MKMTTTAGSGGGGGGIDDEAFARIKMGVNVDIKRSDGKTSTQGCNSIDIGNLRIELEHKLRQGLRTC